MAASREVPVQHTAEATASRVQVVSHFALLTVDGVEGCAVDRAIAEGLTTAGSITSLRCRVKRVGAVGAELSRFRAVLIFASRGLIVSRAFRNVDASATGILRWGSNPIGPPAINRIS
jgi:hypothetical protein